MSPRFLVFCLIFATIDFVTSEVEITPTYHAQLDCMAAECSNSFFCGACMFFKGRSLGAYKNCLDADAFADCKKTEIEE